RFDLSNFRSSGFRFDAAPDPEPDLTFIAAADVNSADFVVELRGADEAAFPVTPHAQRMSLAQFQAAKPAPALNQRAVFACRSGLRAWQAATFLRSYWSGDIELIAMGDVPQQKDY
ncbi:MAG: HesA/MoeB/ThiF family protein, partial [Planktotalea sp.]